MVINEKDERLYKIIFTENEINELIGELDNLNNSLKYPEIYKPDYEKIYAFCYRLKKLRK